MQARLDRRAHHVQLPQVVRLRRDDHWRLRVAALPLQQVPRGVAVQQRVPRQSPGPILEAAAHRVAIEVPEPGLDPVPLVRVAEEAPQHLLWTGSTACDGDSLTSQRVPDAKAHCDVSTRFLCYNRCSF